MNRLLFRRNLDPLHLLQFLDAALHLLGLGRLVAEAVDKYFQLLDAFALISIRRFQLLSPLGLLGKVLVVVAAVEEKLPVPDFDRLLHRDIEEVAIVGNQQEGIRIFVQVFFEPVAGFEIEMIGRLIEQQQVGPLEQELCERQAHLPATRELIR